MRLYSKTFQNTTRASFAREAVLDAFGPRAVPALDEPGFQDRQPDHGPRRIGEVTNKVVDDVGRRTITYWLTRATTSDGAERVAAIETAEKIRQKMGLTWDNLIGQEAA